MIRNPFKTEALRRQFDACVRLYTERHKDLISPRGYRAGNTISTYFWRGYDGSVSEDRWAASDRKTYVFASYRAGQAIRKSEGSNPAFPPTSFSHPCKPSQA